MIATCVFSILPTQQFVAMTVTQDVSSESSSTRNIDELKRLVISALDENGVLTELRSTVKLHVTRAINEDAHSPLVHARNPKMAALMATDRGQLLTELIVDFLRFYQLKDTLSMFSIEASLPRLRPSETELAGQCGFSHSPSVDLSVLEQYLSQQPEVRYAPQHPIANPPEIDIQVPDDSVENESDDSVVINTSLETDMDKLRKISMQMNEIAEEPSPRYPDDFDAASSSSSSGGGGGISSRLLDEDASPLPVLTKRDVRKSSFLDDDDDVLFESRDSFRALGESPASDHPISLNDHIEHLDARQQ